MKSCLGCGVQLQNFDKLAIGFTPKTDANYCQRCFRIKHYDDLTLSLKQGIDSEEVISKINALNDVLIVWVVDLFDFESNMLKNLNQYLVNKDIIFVGTKRDLLPDTLSDEKLRDFIIERLKIYNIEVQALVVTGALHLGMSLIDNELENFINEFRKNRDVCVIGMANAGKSSLLNQLLQYQQLTTSRYPGTTIDLVKIPYHDYTIYDTPGITKYDSLLTHIDEALLKKIIPTTHLKPTVFQLKANQSIAIAGFAKIDLFNCEKVSVVTYFKNDLYVHRTKQEKSEYLWETQFNQLLTPCIASYESMKEITFKNSKKQKMDFVFHGLGWVSVSGDYDEIKIKVAPMIAVSIRKAMI